MAGLKSTQSAQSDIEDFAVIRAQHAMRDGKPEEAARILGRPWTVRAPVEHGDARGRTIGFPTANMHLDEDETLAFGIYAVRVNILDGNGETISRHDGVANFGIRPMFRTQKPLLEAHLFDFSDDIYGKLLAVELVAWLRPEAKFSGLEELVAQIKADAAAARTILGRIS